ncbi:ATP-dependent zinc metalloprotease FtsH [Maribacter polysaccharolyticus]|uniref:ATP-dependent zinc metalloprotease FtsH n=1 Tax=Maribacter polysaccharolyticus TaxID=3020831 RepID=UPI00237F9537|nr:ATP-dependent zinc metalloprotease FtsH [Maribacter polysaccharolyticus]MDE3742553.1 ATP-dependent zinc metalloprotease FtsH [Maribacter polysaccharolyticus]
MKQPDNKDANKEKKINQKPPFWSAGLNWFYLFLFAFLLVFTFFSNPSGSTKEKSWGFVRDSLIAQDKIEKIIVVNKEFAEIYVKKDLTGSTANRNIGEKWLQTADIPQYRITIGSVDSFEAKLQRAQESVSPTMAIDVQYQNRGSWVNIFSWLLPLGIILLFWMYILGKLGGGGKGSNPLFNFGKSTAVLTEKGSKTTVNFKDIAGLKEAKAEVMEVVDFLKNPERYTKLGAKIPKGVMLVGPPGTGKTLMAKAVAGEAQVPFFSMSGSEFVEMFVGVGASRVRDLFKRAKEKSPSIIFIDEIDAVGRSRGKVNAFQANDERESTLNQLLTELDGFGPNTGVIVLAATNRPDVLDKALLRPGRFDRHIYLELPTKEERIEIFNVHLRPIKLSKNVDVSVLAKLSPGFSGADIANICNEAALIAARNKKKAVEQEDFMEARDRVIGGLERKSKIISAKEKEIVAHHEAGHAIVSWFLKNVDSLVKVSIIPRGKSLGSAWYLPEERQIVTKSQFLDQICAALGGRAAEEIIFNETSSGALDDLEKVTKQAYSMVSFYGLDEEIGPISFYDSSGQNERFLGKPYSEHMAQLIDKEVRDLVYTAYERTKNLLIEHLDELKKLAQLLLTQEVVEKEALEELLGKRGLPETGTLPKASNSVNT